jgi:hypothetical protein
MTTPAAIEPDNALMVQKRLMLRHTLATLRYRAEKAVSGLPSEFGLFRNSSATRTPLEILAHIGDLMDWANNLARGVSKWQDSTPLTWNEELSRFRLGLNQLDEYCASNEPLRSSAERLFQGPIADALTHIGQIAMLRGMAGNPLPGENYFKAEIIP